MNTYMNNSKREYTEARSWHPVKRPTINSIRVARVDTIRVRPKPDMRV